MQSWANKGRVCLCGSLRPLSRPVIRSFTTTPNLQRSKAKTKTNLKAASKSSESRKPPPNMGPSIRQDVSYHSFPRIVEDALESFDLPSKNSNRIVKYAMAAARLNVKPGHAIGGPIGQLRAALQTAYINDGMRGLKDELGYMFRAEQYTTKYSTPNLENQKKVADLRYPAEWYPQARSIQRTIHLHVGPTNSGKTYHALKRLQQCESGFYAGPLRLLAQEVYQRFKSTGLPCSLITGDDVQIPEGVNPRIVSNTVEMVPLGQPFDVGVIDEIQMISDPSRGWAWTRALLGARAKELHLCGEPRVIPLIQQLAALTRDKLVIHNYERLNPLRAEKESLRGDLRKLQKGDCVVSFSRLGIHALKREIEKMTGRRAAIVYGSLPAEIRTQQASLFNDPNNDYDFLVASDAIGMGLNLSCKRIVFETLIKRTPRGLLRLSVPEIKQIGGRAGRYRPATQTKGSKKQADEESNVGLVTSMEEVDLPYIRDAMKEEPRPLTAAGILPPDGVVHKFAAYFPQSVPFHYVIKRLMDLSSVSPLFFLCETSAQLESMMLLDPVRGLTTQDRMTLMAAPIHTGDSQSCEIALAFAQCVANNSSGSLLQIPDLPLEVLEEPVSGKKEYLQQLEILHKSVILYAWLSFRFGGVFTDRTLVAHVKDMVEERMIRALSEFSSHRDLRKDSSLRRQISLQKQNVERERLLAEAEMNMPQPQVQAGSSPADLSGDIDEEGNIVEQRAASSTNSA